jgi:hypothetical protein
MSTFTVLSGMIVPSVRENSKTPLASVINWKNAVALVLLIRFTVFSATLPNSICP